MTESKPKQGRRPLPIEKKLSVVCCIRLPAADAQKLEALTKATGERQTDLIRLLIGQAYAERFAVS